MIAPTHAFDASPVVFQAQAALSAGISGEASLRRQYTVRPVSVASADATSVMTGASERLPELGSRPAPVQSGAQPEELVAATARQTGRSSTLAQLSLACGWLFLGLALVCFARGLTSFSARRRRVALALQS